MGTQIYAIIGIGVIAAAIAIVLRQVKPEYAMLVSLMAGVFILYKLFADIVPITAQIELMLSSSRMSDGHIRILFRAMGICLITQIACDVCKDAGENAIASKIEMAGRICVLAISIPLYNQVLSIVHSLMR